MNKKPLVSVLMTAYNAERFISQAIESIINQTYKNWELIVVDDGSSDATLKIVERYAKKNSRIKVFAMEKNGGPSVASNAGMKHVRGSILARMDADDISTPDRLEKQVRYILDNPDTILLGGQCTLIDEEARVIGIKSFPTDHESIYEALFTINPVQHPSCMINMALLPKGHELYHDVDVLAHDLELVFELSQYGKLANLGDVVLFYRQYATSLSLKNPKRTFEATLGVRRRAIKNYKYRPTTKAWATNMLQRVVLTFLPSEAIYPLFIIMRTRSSGDYLTALPQIFRFIKYSFKNRVLSAQVKARYAFSRVTRGVYS